uniref:Retrotransposon gag domain-containing protein n=1 Tax=Populus alba TaxID=43335 RepID=A0A4U5Q3E1_POPAL|nr:hypothetical protein D5086_0000141070 [Populus alba]
MDTRGKTNAEFRAKITEALGRHDANFDELNQNFNRVNDALQGVMAELQAMRIAQTHRSSEKEVNPFAGGSSSHDRSSANLNVDRNHTTLKLNFPTYSGEGDDPTGWIFKAEQYFEFQNIDAPRQVQLASFHLSSVALQWYRWYTKNKGQLRWHEFVSALLHRFGPTEYDDPSEALSRLKQTTTVNAYQEAFEKLSHKVDDLPESFLVGCFIAGLKDEIRLDVRVKQPKSLSESISVAHLIEERNQFQRKLNNPARTATTTPFQPKPAHPNTLALLGPVPVQRTAQPATPIRHITGQEAKERREKGLCFYCDERYVPGHRCSRPQMFMMVDVQQKEEGEDMDMEIVEPEEDIPEISFHALVGTNHPQTFQVIGKAGNTQVTVLIDGGSTHNFIDQSTATKLGLLVIHDKTIQVTVGNKEIIECTGRCLGLALSIQGIIVRADFFVLPVAACQVVLGVQWLETLGPIKTDYKKLIMLFKKGGQTSGIFCADRSRDTDEDSPCMVT